MQVYFFDKCEETLTQIRRVAEAWGDVTFFYNASLTSFFDALRSHESIVVFMDTRLHTKRSSSFALAARIRHLNPACHIVFMSAHLEDMSFCFRNLLRPSGFLLKPMSDAELDGILKMVSQTNLEQAEQEEEKIKISVGDTLYAFRVDEVLYFTTFGKKIQCVTETESIEFYGTLKELETRLDTYFIRCHSGFLVNKVRVQGIKRDTLLLRCSDKTVPISKTYKKKVRATFMK